MMMAPGRTYGITCVIRQVLRKLARIEHECSIEESQAFTAAVRSFLAPDDTGTAA